MDDDRVDGNPAHGDQPRRATAAGDDAPDVPDRAPASSAASHSGTGACDDVVDLCALTRLDGVQLAEQVAIYEQLHQGVQAALSRIENG